MNIKTVFFKGKFGRGVVDALGAGTESRKECHMDAFGWQICEIHPGIGESDGMAVVLSGPDIGQLLKLEERMSGRTWLAAFPFERHIVVTPVFGLRRTCVRCFVRRWMSQPPEGYHPEVVSAIVTMVSTTPSFEYTNLSPLAPDLSASAMADSAARNASHALCLDQAGEAVMSTTLRPLHGCVCRGKGDGDASRFGRFDDALHALVSRHLKAPASEIDGEVTR